MVPELQRGSTMEPRHCLTLESQRSNPTAGRLWRAPEKKLAGMVCGLSPRTIVQ